MVSESAAGMASTAPTILINYTVQVEAMPLQVWSPEDTLFYTEVPLLKEMSNWSSDDYSVFVETLS